MSKVPEEWSYEKLGKVCDIIGGGTPSRDVAEFWKGIIPWVGPSQVANLKTMYISDADESISELGLKKSSAKLLPVGTVLMTSRATIGYPAINTVPMATNQGFQSLCCKGTIFNQFLYQLIIFMRDELTKVAAGSTFLEVSSSTVKEFLIPVPPLSEQKKIAEILSSVDRSIEATEKLIAKLSDLKKALMQELFTKGIGHTRFKDSPLGRIPEEWDVQILNSLCTRIGDGIHGTPRYTNNSTFFFINGNNLSNGKIIITDSTKCVDKDEYLLHKKELDEQSILLSINGTIGNLAFFQGENIMLGKSAAYINLKKDINKQFIYYQLQTQYVKVFFDSELTGTTIKNLSLKSIRETRLCLPPKKEQQQITSILWTNDKKIDKAQARLEKLRDMKKGLMQDLLTGKVRV